VFDELGDQDADVAVSLLVSHSLSLFKASEYLSFDRDSNEFDFLTSNNNDSLNMLSQNLK
jgi:hypothetical protein